MGLPLHSATRLLHNAIFLQMFDFEIEYRISEWHGNADCLSRLPITSQDWELIERLEADHTTVFHLEQINTLPILPQDIRKATIEDPETREIFEKLKRGMPVGANGLEYSLQSGCVFNGIRVYIPKKLRTRVLNELHDAHLGVVKMKSLARSVVYWPNIDGDIEKVCRNCRECVMTQKQPSKSDKHYWEYPSSTWERIHIDHAGPFMGQIFFIVVDAYSKWLEVSVVPSASAKPAINVLESLFARYGFPRTVVSDNGSAFTSLEFQNFLKLYAIKHITVHHFTRLRTDRPNGTCTH